MQLRQSISNCKSNYYEDTVFLLGQLVSTWQVEMGWPDIHWLARDLGWAGGSHGVSFGQELEYAVGA